MNDLLRKLVTILSRRDKWQLAGLFLLILGGASLEVLGLGIIFPLVSLLSSPDIVYENPYIKMVYDWIEPDSFNEFMIWMGGGVVLVYVLKNAYLLMVTYLQGIYYFNAYLRFSSQLFVAYLYSPFTFHLNHNSAQMLRNLQIVQSVVQGIIQPLLQILTALVVVLSIVSFLMFSIPGVFFLIIGVFGAFVGIFILLIRKKVNYYGHQLKIHGVLAIQQVNQGIGSIKETKILGREDCFNRAYRHHLLQTVQAQKFQYIISSLPKYIGEVMVVSLVVLIMVLALLQGEELATVLTTISMFGVAAIRLLPAVVSINSSLSLIHFYSPFLDEVYEDLVKFGEFTPSLKRVGSPDAMPFHHEIKVDHVSFQYETAQNLALNDVTLTIPKNSSVGFVGTSGAGKTTIADLILGLFPPSLGQVLVDGCDIHKALSSWQNMIGYIPQSIYIMDDTIRGNVAMGLLREEIDEEKIWQALRLAQLEDFVRALPQGLDTMMGEHGVRVSGGQKQRVGIARALYREPEVLVMDEATASLDTETEQAFMRSIEALSGKKTFIIIAHRLTTVQSCDTIFLFDAGRLEAFGTYEELLANCAKFQKISGGNGML